MKTSLLALAILCTPVLSAHAAGDVANGETVFKKCTACHAVGEGAVNKVGPELNDLIGRTAGSVDGYKYSKAMVDAGAGGLVWDEASLTEFLTGPRAKVPGTKMSFAGLKDASDTADVIAYLATFGAAP
ncbi:cytochrome C [Devosia limi DSM 17137]|uniref:Cytochrome C n=1 Tax=Devosia limi DSM 17137 TaxID=1121477 RepID=A0A0F5LTS9_9HYPH|nr:cytochrome c family protein [Devosia limi]KKB85748.1 cytochrome C [Devosia limi DSM 17137]SHE31041.1 cytochrome c [Devosia limi DSM 17137]